MDIRLKHRLVGAVVLISIGVIFIPMLLDGTPPEPVPAVLEPLPPMPVESLVPKRIDLELPPLPAAPTVTATEPPPPAPPAAKIPADEPNAWAVQIGSFSDRAKARAQLKKLRGMGFTAYDETIVDSGGKALTRVRVGPEIDRARMERVRDDVAKRLGIDTPYVVRHR